MHLTPVRPAERHHLRCGIELHGTTAKRDHAMYQGKVNTFQLPDVAHHQCFTVVCMKYRMREVFGSTCKRSGNGVEASFMVNGKINRVFIIHERIDHIKKV